MESVDCTGSSTNNGASQRHLEESKFLLYKLQMIEALKVIDQDLVVIDKNLKELAMKSGPFKDTLEGLLTALPMPFTQILTMETDYN